MKNLLMTLCLLAPSFASAEKPAAPENIKFADVCLYRTWSHSLTCQDAGGNVLIDGVSIYKQLHAFAPSKLDAFAMMKQLGFDVKSTMKVGYDFEVIFFRQP